MLMESLGMAALNLPAGLRPGKVSHPVGHPCSSPLLDGAFLALGALAIGQRRILGLLPLPRAD